MTPRFRRLLLALLIALLVSALLLFFIIGGGAPGAPPLLVLVFPFLMPILGWLRYETTSIELGPEVAIKNFLPPTIRIPWADVGMFRYEPWTFSRQNAGVSVVKMNGAKRRIHGLGLAGLGRLLGDRMVRDIVRRMNVELARVKGIDLSKITSPYLIWAIPATLGRSRVDGAGVRAGSGVVEVPLLTEEYGQAQIDNGVLMRTLEIPVIRRPLLISDVYQHGSDDDRGTRQFEVNFDQATMTIWVTSPEGAWWITVRSIDIALGPPEMTGESVRIREFR